MMLKVSPNYMKGDTFCINLAVRGAVLREGE